MKKRQKKKNQKKYLLVLADEFNLMTMTPDELKKAEEDFNKYREKYAFRKKYKDLKNQKPLVYYYPPGDKMMKSIKDVSSSGRRQSKTTVTQSLSDFN